MIEGTGEFIARTSTPRLSLLYGRLSETFLYTRHAVRNVPSPGTTQVADFLNITPRIIGQDLSENITGLRDAEGSLLKVSYLHICISLQG